MYIDVYQFFIGSHFLHKGVMLFEFSIAHISCSVSCKFELKLGTNDEEGITQQIITLCISMLGIF